MQHQFWQPWLVSRYGPLIESDCSLARGTTASDRCHRQESRSVLPESQDHLGPCSSGLRSTFRLVPKRLAGFRLSYSSGEPPKCEFLMRREVYARKVGYATLSSVDNQYFSVSLRSQIFWIGRINVRLANLADG